MTNMMLFFALALVAAVQEQIRVVRDDRAIPHIFANTTVGAAYGLGRVHAEDRLFQMFFRRAWMDGTLAEYFGAGVQSQWTNYDFQARVLGWRAHAEMLVASGLYAYTVAVMEAYADGVNDAIAAKGSNLGDAFATTSIVSIAPWRAADCLLAWWAMMHFGGNNVLTHIISEMDFEPFVCPTGCPEVVDELRAMGNAPTSKKKKKKKREAPPYWFDYMGDYWYDMNLHASHGWVVGASRRSDGKPAAICVASPQMPVNAPAYWYTDHVHAAFDGIDARGQSAPGAVGHVLGFTKNLCTSISSAGQGEALDMVEITPFDANSYVVDGVPEAYTHRVETIKVRAGADVVLTVKETRYGPIVDDLLDLYNKPLLLRNASKLYAVSHVVLRRKTTADVVARLGVWKAKSIGEYRQALYHTTVPFAHEVAGFKDGQFTYNVFGAIPKRGDTQINAGRRPFDGSISANDWQGFMTSDEKPHAINRPEGYSVSANGLAAGAWYPHYTGLLHQAGESNRGERIHRLFEAMLPNEGSKMTMAQAYSIADDGVNVNIDDFCEVLKKMNTTGVWSAAEMTLPAASRAHSAYQMARAVDYWGADRRSNDLNPYFALGTQHFASHNNFRCLGPWKELTCYFGNGPHGRLRMLRELRQGTAPAFMLNVTHDGVCKQVQPPTQAACDAVPLCTLMCARLNIDGSCQANQCREVSIAHMLDSAAKAYEKAIEKGAPADPQQWATTPVPPLVPAYPMYQADFFCWNANSWGKTAICNTALCYIGAQYTNCELQNGVVGGVLLDQVEPPVLAMQVQGGSTPISQFGLTYRYRVDMADIDGTAEDLAPVGVSEDPSNPSFVNALDDWRANKYRPAPLSESLINKQSESVYSYDVTVSPPPPGPTPAPTAAPTPSLSPSPSLSPTASHTAAADATPTPPAPTPTAQAAAQTSAGGGANTLLLVAIGAASCLVLVLGVAVCGVLVSRRRSRGASRRSNQRNSRVSRYSRRHSSAVHQSRRMSQLAPAKGPEAMAQLSTQISTDSAGTIEFNRPE